MHLRETMFKGSCQISEFWSLVWLENMLSGMYIIVWRAFSLFLIVIAVKKTLSIF